MSLDLRGADMLPSEYFGGDRISKDTSQLICYTADQVCTTCDWSDLCEGNGARGIYISCQLPDSPFGTHQHNALQGCDKHTKIL